MSSIVVFISHFCRSCMKMLIDFSSNISTPKKNGRIFFFLCLFMLIAYNVSACTKVMRWNDDPPFTFVDDQNNGHIQGISVDIARAIFKELKCELKLSKMPWARALESLKFGHIDLISGAFNTDERQSFAHFSSINEHSPNILFLRTGEEEKWQLTSLADITKHSFKLGVQIDVSYSSEFESLKKQVEFAKQLHPVSNRESLWKMLSLGRIDGVIADKVTGLIELKKLKLSDNIGPSSLIISNEPAFFAFSKKTVSREFVNQFDSVYQRLLNDGTVKNIEYFYINQ